MFPSLISVAITNPAPPEGKRRVCSTGSCTFFPIMTPVIGGIILYHHGTTKTFWPKIFDLSQICLTVIMAWFGVGGVKFLHYTNVYYKLIKNDNSYKKTKYTITGLKQQLGIWKQPVSFNLHILLSLANLRTVLARNRLNYVEWRLAPDVPCLKHERKTLLACPIFVRLEKSSELYETLPQIHFFKKKLLFRRRIC